MRVEAIKQEDGLFIPMQDSLSKISAQRVMVDIEIMESAETNDYDALDQLIGICETGIPDASIDHDNLISLF